MGDESYSECRSERVAVGLLGLGSIGLSVVQLLHGESGLRIVGALVRRPGVRGGIHEVPIVHSLNDLLDLRPDVIAEVAGQSALKTYGPTILRSRSDLVISSVGALADRDFLIELQAAAAATGRTLEIAAGAIGALDAIAAAALGGLDRVTYLVRRSADRPLPHVMSHDPPTEREIFSGSAREAALRFPENLNAAAALGFAGLGLDRTEVRVVVDPTVDGIHHEIVATGHFGQLNMSIATPESPIAVGGHECRASATVPILGADTHSLSQPTHAHTARSALLCRRQSKKRPYGGTRGHHFDRVRTWNLGDDACLESPLFMIHWCNDPYHTNPCPLCHSTACSGP